jgi:hypothetical protein
MGLAATKAVGANGDNAKALFRRRANFIVDLTPRQAGFSLAP